MISLYTVLKWTYIVTWWLLAGWFLVSVLP